MSALLAECQPLVDDTVAQETPCATRDPELWFPTTTSGVERAKTLCEPCPLRAKCLEAALDRGEPWGVWGGQWVENGKVVAVKRGRGRPRLSQA